MQLLCEELEGCVVDLNVLFTMRGDDSLRVSGYGRGSDDVAGVMIFMWNLRRGSATAVAKGAVVHPHLVLEIGAGLIIEAVIDVPHQVLVHPHVFPCKSLRYSQIIAHMVARRHLIERLPDESSA